jgi:general nucleoside transport system ATP-binding protein
MTDPALEYREVSVSYGHVPALVGVSAAFAPRMIHAVTGQNGAGKTTFARVAAGMVVPQTGKLLVDGNEISAGDVGVARKAGVKLVHQSFALPPSFTVAEAMELSATDTNGFYTRRRLDARWAKHLASLDIRVSPRDRIRDLPIEAQQGVEIARALATRARLLILDEPTSVLSPRGIEALFRRLRTMKDSGVTIVLILHKLREVLAIADTITVLRSGRLVEGPLPAAATDANCLAATIIGSAIDPMLPAVNGRAPAAVGRTGPARLTPKVPPLNAVLTVASVATRAYPVEPALDSISLEVGRSEIVGIAGFEGNGQRTLVRVIAGLADTQAGRIELAGSDATSLSLRERRVAGLRIIPFERDNEGLSLSSAVWENWAAARLVRGGTDWFISPRKLRKVCEDTLRTWDVRFSAPDQPASSLSGGNAQKLILAREIDGDARVIVAAQPARGLDVGAAIFVWRALRDARARGCGILVISSDIEELIDISDRIVIMLAGRIGAEFHPPYRLNDISNAMTDVGQ